MHDGSPCVRKSSIASLARRGRYHRFDRLDPRGPRLLVIDMQETFCEPGAPAEVPASRDIVAPINRSGRGCCGRSKCRSSGFCTPIRRPDGRSDWELFFNHFVADEVRERTIESLAPGRQQIWSELDVAPTDHIVSRTATAR